VPEAFAGRRKTTPLQQEGSRTMKKLTEAQFAAACADPLVRHCPHARCRRARRCRRMGERGSCLATMARRRHLLNLLWAEFDRQTANW